MTQLVFFFISASGYEAPCTAIPSRVQHSDPAHTPIILLWLSSIKLFSDGTGSRKIATFNGLSHSPVMKTLLEFPIFRVAGSVERGHAADALPRTGVVSGPNSFSPLDALTIWNDMVRYVSRRPLRVPPGV